MNTQAPRIRICHLVADVGLGRGEAYLDLANHLAESESEVEIGLLIPKQALFRHRITSRVRVLEYGARNSRNNPWLWLEISRLLKEFHPDLVHTHFAKATEIFRMVNRWLRLPHVATKHNPRRGAVFEKVPHVIAVAEVVRKSIRNPKVTVIYNGIIPKPVAKPACRPGAALKLLSVGRLDPIKGYDRLIPALKAINRPWQLTILGEGEQRDELQRMVQGLGFGGRVILPGFRNDIPEQMATCDLFVMASHSEGCSVALLEAMHYAPLAISTRVGLAAELFPDWLLWNPEVDGSLAAVVNQYEARAARFAEWVRPRLADFHLDATVRQHLACYRALLGFVPRSPFDTVGRQGSL